MKLTRLFSVAVLMMAVAATGSMGCATPSSAPGPRSSSADSTPDSTPKPKITPEMATRVAEEIVREIEALRGLKFDAPVPVQVIDDEQARAHMLRRLQRFEMDEQMALASQAYRLLGLLPDDIDMVETVLDVMREQAGGFYDPDQEVFYILSDMPGVMLPMITAHELTHALEDQHFDLDARLESFMENDDRLFAVSAVHEGSAMVLMSLFSAQRAMTGLIDPAEFAEQAQEQEAQQAALADLPPVLLRQLLGPYVLGVGFLTRGNLLQAMAGGFPSADVDHAFVDGPLSSEQILHPEKYWDADARDDPQVVEIGGVGKVLGRRWKQAAEGVLGELTLGVLVGAKTPAADALMMMRPPATWTNKAAAGWGGDRWQLWKRGKAAAMVAVVEWDTEADVQEFVDALPEDSPLSLKQEGTRLALVAGKVGRKKDALLEVLLKSGGVVPSE